MLKREIGKPSKKKHTLVYESYWIFFCISVFRCCDVQKNKDTMAGMHILFLQYVSRVAKHAKIAEEAKYLKERQTRKIL